MPPLLPGKKEAKNERLIKVKKDKVKRHRERKRKVKLSSVALSSD